MVRSRTLAWSLALTSAVAACGARSQLFLDSPSDARDGDDGAAPSSSDGSSPAGDATAPHGDASPRDAALADAKDAISDGSTSDDAGDAGTTDAPADDTGSGPPDAVADAPVEASADAPPGVSCDVGYGPPAIIPIGCWPGSIVIADLDGDGRRDLLLTADRGSSNVEDVQSLLFFRNLGARSFAAEIAYTGSDDTLGTDFRGLAIADLTGQGRVDVVIGNGTNSSLDVFLDPGGGLLAPQVPVPIGNIPDGGRDSISDVAAGDFDGDGLADVAVSEVDFSETSGGGVGVLLNQGGGVLGPETSFPNTVVAGPMGGTYERGPEQIVAADMNRDGRLDLVTSNTDAHIAVYLNVGHGAFAPEALYPTGMDGPSNVISGAGGFLTVGDVDGDGFLDVVVRNNGGPALGVLLNDRHGNLQPEAPIVAAVDFGGAYYLPELADLSAGRLDLVAAAMRGGVSIFRNAGGGAFSTPPAQYPTTAGDTLEAMAIDDLDGDGLKDIAIAESSHCQIEVMYGRCL